MQINKKTTYSILVIGLSLIFFWLYSYTIWSTWLPQWLATKQMIFNWPDANANYFFAESFSRLNSLFSLEYLNFWTDNLLHTRSINVINGWLVPMTFLPGLLIFGLAFKLLGPLSILFLTPILAVATVFIIYQLFYRIWHDLDLSLLCALLLLPLAPWLFFTNEAMLPVILFIFLLSFGLLGLFLFAEKKSNLWFIIGSWLILCALAVRPTEILWVAVLLLLLWYFNYKLITKKQIIIAALLFIFTALASLSLNKAVYGSWWLFGYLNLQNNSLPTEFASGHRGLIGYLQVIILPFGWQTRLLLSNTWHYLVELMWPYYLLALLSWWYLKDQVFNRQSLWFKYFIATSLVSIIILIYYANWDLADPLVKQYNTISISYVRYFLPIYILILPFVAKAILGLSNLKQKYLAVSWPLILVIILGIFSVRLAYYSPYDGLVANTANLQSYYRQFVRVQNYAPKHSVIITERSDKIFFPYYRVVVPQGDLPLWPRIAKIKDKTPIYFYTSQPADKLLEVKQEAEESGLTFQQTVEINEEFKLIKIEFKE